MKKLREYCLHKHLEALWNVPLAPYSSFRIGGPADVVLFPQTEEELAQLLAFLETEQIRYRVFGRATNLLFSDAGFRGALVTTRHMTSLSVCGETLRASSGLALNALCRAAEESGLGGAEALYGIPGTIGGAVCMNAGAYGTEIKDVLAFATVYDTERQRVLVLPKEKCGFSYRDSALRRNRRLILLSADLTLSAMPKAQITEKMRKICRKRSEKQPLQYPSAGSAFRRPQGDYAGRLIAEAGLCGTRIGGAAVSRKHAGFIINIGGATASDVLSLLSVVQTKVEEKTGVALSPEIEYVEPMPDSCGQ